MASRTGPGNPQLLLYSRRLASVRTEVHGSDEVVEAHDKTLLQSPGSSTQHNLEVDR